jgi:hypothetical protein
MSAAPSALNANPSRGYAAVHDRATSSACDAMASGRLSVDDITGLLQESGDGRARLGQGGDAWVGVLPERQESFVRGTGFGPAPLPQLCSPETDVSEREQG